MTDNSGVIILVESNLPPKPVSITAISTFSFSKYLKAKAVVHSKKLGSITSKELL